MVLVDKHTSDKKDKWEKKETGGTRETRETRKAWLKFKIDSGTS